LSRDEFFARAGLAGDEHRNIGGRDFLELSEHFHHRRTDADDVAKALVLQLGGELLLVGAKSAEEHRVLKNERCLTREDAEKLELRFLEESLDAIVADVKRSRDLTL